MKMKAGVLTVCGAPRPFAKSKPIHVVEVDLDPPGEGEVLVKVGGAGLCHSDLSLINGDRPRPVPIVLGHEGAGEIVELGKGVHDVKVGDHVCFTFNVSCGRSPLISDRSEWQRPAPPTLTSTSPSPGGSRSTSTTWMGFDLAKGRGAPQVVRTPAFIFMGYSFSHSSCLAWGRATPVARSFLCRQ